MIHVSLRPICIAYAVGMMLVFTSPRTLADQNKPTSLAAIQASYKTPTDDGDGPDDELLYHWQNPLYSRDEQKQIGAVLIFLGLVGAYSYVKGGKRPCPPLQ